MQVAIMQPYFIPYAGYFRLLQSSDLFVIYDCVQFTRRGYVHRNQLQNAKDESIWVTLPLAKAPQDVKIADLTFAEDAKSRMQEQQAKFALFKQENYLQSEFNSSLLDFSLDPVQYIIQVLKLSAQRLNVPFNIIRSSELNLSPELKGQDRIIAIAKHFNAKNYVNAAGGRELYDEATFKQHNLTLKFLADYAGSYQSILPRLFNEDLTQLKNEIVSQSIGL